MNEGQQRGKRKWNSKRKDYNRREEKVKAKGTRKMEEEGEEGKVEGGWRSGRREEMGSRGRKRSGEEGKGGEVEGRRTWKILKESGLF